MEEGEGPKEHWVQTQPWLLRHLREAGESYIEFLQVGFLAEHSLIRFVSSYA
jgi:hypothetical protein